MTTEHHAPDMDEARTIAADWHGGQGSALYAFASTGDASDMDRLRDEIHQCRREADEEQRQRLGVLLRACEEQHRMWSRELARELRHVPDRPGRTLCHTEPGAMDPDKERVARDLERAQALDFRVHLAFMADYGQVLDALSRAYRHPDLARAALERHADRVARRIGRS